MAKLMNWVGSALFAAALHLPPAAAQTLPPEVEAARREAAAACTGRASFEPGYIQTADFNGDGRPDYLISEEKVKCSGGPPPFCGSGGCSWTLFLSAPAGYRKALDGLDHRLAIDRSVQPPALVTESRGGRARLQWNGRAMAPAGRR